jgi:hypothetical protein
MFIGEKQREKHVRENDHCYSVKKKRERDRDIVEIYKQEDGGKSK